MSQKRVGLWLGVDTGGTYTDAVLLSAENQSVIASAKRLTRHDDLASSLRAAIKAVLQEAKPKASHIALVSISTTLATNAIVEGHGGHVCSLLIGYDADMAKRSRLHELGDIYHLVEGGHDGYGQEKQPLDESKVADLAERHKHEVEAFAISSLFSVRNNKHELRAKEIVRAISGLPVTCGYELTSQLDAPRRALTVALNARLIPRLQHLIEAMRIVLMEENIQAPLMVVRGDGSLLRAEEAIQRPVETILSGPAASLMGMQFLTGLSDMMMSDIGGTTTDIAILQNGYPKTKEEGAEIGGYRTMVRAIDVHSYGLGGDSELHIHPDLSLDSSLTLGPKRVIPLALFAEEYPETTNLLEQQRADTTRLIYPARLLIKQIKDNLYFKNHAEKRLYDSLPTSPILLSDLALGPSSMKALDHLIERDAVRMSGPTPSDALHVLGKQQTWSPYPAQLGFELLARYQGLGLSAESLAEKTFEQLIQKSAMLLLNIGFDRPVDQSDFLQSLIEENVKEGQHPRSYSRRHLIDYSFCFSLPLAAAGASAHLYYPSIAKRVGAELFLPSYASVANAIGAAIGAVVGEVEILITQPKPGLFRLHLGEKLLDCEKEEEALKLAETEARNRAVLIAQANGAAQIETAITIERVEMDRNRLLEAKVIARATSRLFPNSLLASETESE